MKHFSVEINFVLKREIIYQTILVIAENYHFNMNKFQKFLFQVRQTYFRLKGLFVCIWLIAMDGGDK